MIPRDIPGLVNDLLSAFGLLSRLPLPQPRNPRGAPAAWAWPLVGTAIGTIAAAIATILLALGLPVSLAAVAVLATQALATGALHEDGLADTADGFFGGWTPARRLEIMKDSHIGSYGTLALILTVLARWAALTAILHIAIWPVIAVAALSRLPMAALIAALPNARGTGLSQSVGKPDLQTLLIATALALIISILMVELAATLLTALVIAATTLGLAMLARARIGGQTGDVLGCAQQLAEVTALATLAAIIA
ncbi:MAG: adenosylcobinamide-GDP ribazoletransferase [Paracoccaceae bacterium]